MLLKLANARRVRWMWRGYLSRPGLLLDVAVQDADDQQLHRLLDRIGHRRQPVRAGKRYSTDDVAVLANDAQKPALPKSVTASDSPTHIPHTRNPPLQRSAYSLSSVSDTQSRTSTRSREQSATRHY